MSDDFDFGFSAVSEEELTRPIKEELTRPIKKGTDALSELSNLFLSFVGKLQANPDKEYIHWPNRIDKLKSLESKIKQIVAGARNIGE